MTINLKTNSLRIIPSVIFAFATTMGLMSATQAEETSTKFVVNQKIDKATLNQAARDALPEQIRKKGYLIVGGETTLPPYLYRKDGAITGIEADFMQAVGQALGLRIKLINTNFSSLVIGLTSGRLDVAMSDFSDTLAREKQVTFVDYTKTGQQLIVAKGNPKNIHSVKDLCGVAAGGPAGSLSLSIAVKQSAECVKAGKPAVDIHSYPSASNSDLALRTGRIDTMGIDYAIASNIVSSSKGKTELTGDLFSLGYHGAAVDKNNKKMVKALLLAYQGIFKQGIDGQILEAWGVPQMRLTHPQVNAMQKK